MRAKARPPKDAGFDRASDASGVVSPWRATSTGSDVTGRTRRPTSQVADQPGRGCSRERMTTRSAPQADAASASRSGIGGATSTTAVPTPNARPPRSWQTVSTGSCPHWARAHSLGMRRPDAACHTRIFASKALAAAAAAQTAAAAARSRSARRMRRVTPGSRMTAAGTARTGQPQRESHRRHGRQRTHRRPVAANADDDQIGPTCRHRRWRSERRVRPRC
jgi:hypothetical protein